MKMKTNGTRASRLLLTTALGLLSYIGNAQAVDVVTYYHTDGLGTPVMESNAAGQVTYTREHRPYGEQSLGAAKNGPGFTGHVGDADTGLIYMQARYFDPAAGRFLSNDPVLTNPNTGSLFNRYGYALNNPYHFTDPDGRLPRGYSNLCSMWCDSWYVAGGAMDQISVNDSSPNPKDPPPPPSAEMPKPVQDAINKAGERVNKEGDAQQIAAWEKTIWKWDPENRIFKLNPAIKAFVDPKIPNTVVISAGFAEFADPKKYFSYHQASFRGGEVGILFVALHEFAHVWTAGRGAPGTPERERLANMVAFGWLPRIYRPEVTCKECIQ